MSSYGGADTEPAAEAPDEEEEPRPALPELPDLETRKEAYLTWAESTHEERCDSFTWRDYYDGIQHTKEEVDELENRGQPVVTINKIAPKIDTTTGEEIARRVDPDALPRTPLHADDAKAMRDSLRFVEEEQQTDKVRSRVFESMLIEGIGGALKSVEKRGDRVVHKLEYIPYDRLCWDIHSRSLEFADARWLGLTLWLDYDDAVARWPDKADALRSAIDGQGSAALSGDDGTDDVPRHWVDKKRDRVKVVEMFWRVEQGWYRFCFTGVDDLEEPSDTGYFDEYDQPVCNLVMQAMRVTRNGRHYGAVKPMISPQDEHNKRRSKALHLLSVDRTIAEDHAIPDPQGFQTERAKPDGLAIVAPGAMQNNRVQVQSGIELAAAHVQLMQMAAADLDIIGPSSSTIPELPSSASGVAIQGRSEMASRQMGSAFDGLRDWTHRVTLLDWYCIRRHWTKPMWLRVTDDQELTGYRFIQLNRQTTRAERFAELMKDGSPPPVALRSAAGEAAPVVMRDVQQATQVMGQGAPPEQAQQMQTALISRHPLMQQPITINDVAKTLVDVVIDSTPETAVLAQQQFEILSRLAPALIQQRPDIAPALARMLVDASALPNKQALLEQMDKGPDPQQAKLQQAMQQIGMAQAQAGVQVAKAQAQLNAARAGAEQAKTQQAGAKLPSEIAKNQAAAQKDIAAAQPEVMLAMPAGPPGVV